jgi:hypothetical protein
VKLGIKEKRQENGEETCMERKVNIGNENDDNIQGDSSLTARAKTHF